MVKNSQCWKQLISLMEQEEAILNTMAETSKHLRDKLHRRDWASLEETFKELENSSTQLSTLERQRVEMSTLIGKEGRLEYLANNLEVEMRARFTRIRSNLRVRLLTLKSQIQGINSYTKSRYRFSREIMQALYPSTRGEIYDQRGHADSGERESMFLSRHL